VIPIGVDSELFRLPTKARDENTICWIGAPYHIKGWDTFLSIVADMPDTPFVVVTKVKIVRPSQNVVVYELVEHKDLPAIMGFCTKLLCTSRLETQHLAGIEAGLCGVPVVSSRVGIYADLADGAWGRCLSVDAGVDEWVDALQQPMECGSVVRQFWLDAGLSESKCVEKWSSAIKEVMDRGGSRHATEF
jgi:glycosyltransferase involved in cell wall biosynthesis